MGVGIGLAVSNARAALGGLVSRGGEFVRTPKYKFEDSEPDVSASSAEGGRGRRGKTGNRDWKALRYRAGRSLTFVLEGLLALYFAVTVVLAWAWGMWLSIPFLALFLHGYGYMFWLSLRSATGRPEAVAASGHPPQSAATTRA
jgi:hypothetical protein